MPNLIDMVGKRAGRLVVVSRAPNDRFGCAMWECRCDCGKSFTALGQNIRIGKTSSCGCLRSDRTKERLTTHGFAPKGRPSPEYKIWLAMKARCTNQRNPAYNLYGGRGVKICDEWIDSFENFFRDVGERPSKRHSLDRIDCNGNYEPSNCRWATWVEQQNNRRNNRVIEINGTKNTLANWMRILGVNRCRLYSRIYRGGWDVVEALLAA